MKRLMKRDGSKDGTRTKSGPSSLPTPDNFAFTASAPAAAGPRRQRRTPPVGETTNNARQQYKSSISPRQSRPASVSLEIGVGGGRAGNGQQHQAPQSRSDLPSAWKISIPALHHTDPLCITMNSQPPTSLCANRPVPTAFLESSSTSSTTISSLYPSVAHGSSSSTQQVYYFEVTVNCTSASTNVEMAVGFFSETENYGAWPGEVPGSIGWGSDGLCVNGRKLDGSGALFRNGDVVGCGMEVGGMQRAFFTRNGSLVVPPSSQKTSFVSNTGMPCIPAVGFRHGSRDVLAANFGLDPTVSFQWTGSDGLVIHPSQSGRRGKAAPYTSPSPLGSANRKSTKTSNPSPYYDMSGLDEIDNPIMPSTAGSLQPGRPEPLTARSAPRGPSRSASPPHGSYFGVQTNARKNLVDDDPSETNAATASHFNLRSSMSSPKGWSPPPASSRFQTPPMHPNPPLPLSPATRVKSTPIRVSPQAQSSEPGSPRRTSSLPDVDDDPQERIKEQRRKERAERQRNRAGRQQRKSRTSHSPTPPSKYDDIDLVAKSFHDNDDSEILAPPTLDARGSSLAVAAAGVLAAAKEHSTKLTAEAKKMDIDGALVMELLSSCKADQAKLQVKLNTALEEADAVDDLEELFAVNDGILRAIEAGDAALKKAKSKEKKRSSDGPTIELLAENQDVFSLICMLRAPGEKRMAAALALMQFAREDEMLRNEIRSSGGMHSFLTLFRTKGMSRELQVVASMAVAYVLPSYVVSSQTESNVGLKIMECLRFLAITSPCSPQDVSITKDEMIKAASLGVNVLWVHAIQPLLELESVKNESSQKKPVLTPSSSIKLGRLRGRAGAGVFDQDQESIEVQELTDLSISLIARIAKLNESRGVGWEIGYNIVEQICEVDVARPIVVREGLLKIFVNWIRSKNVDKIRPAASALRYLISIQDQYMAGWIHSQVVNEGAVGEIVKLLNESVGHDVRVAVAEMLSALCVAPHTRDAVVEANCVSYLVALLYEHHSPASREMVYCACSALLQLAAGAMILADGMGGISLKMGDSSEPDEHDKVINDIFEGWAHGNLAQIALEHKGKLQSVSVEALRVLSEDTNKTRQARLQLCSVGATEALGKTLKDNFHEIQPLEKPDKFDMSLGDSDSPFAVSVKDVHEALRGLANIFEPRKERFYKQEKRGSQDHQDRNETLIKGCVDIIKSGGFESLIWISSLPYRKLSLPGGSVGIFSDRVDLLEESCRLLANIAPLLLTDSAASHQIAGWASSVFEALDGILNRENEQEGEGISDATSKLNIDALRGLGALARYEPFKIRMVDKSLPKLIYMKGLSGEWNELSNSASQVLLSLGFTEDEITVQVAGNNPTLLVDWFCLQRALLIQAMARAELRLKIAEMWELPFADADVQHPKQLIRQASCHSTTSGNSEETSIDSTDLVGGLFENFTTDGDSEEIRDSVLHQYRNVYKHEARKRKESNSFKENKDGGLIYPHMFPLSDTGLEKEWMLCHAKAMECVVDDTSAVCPVGVMPERIEKLLDCCFPSKVLRNDILPINDLRPQSSFDFRALMMPQRRYFSFRREGQLLARLCEKQAATLDTDDVHWTLGFTNSTFAGEFVESLVQFLYLCPMITGLSFARNAEWFNRDNENDTDGEDGGGLLANLAGSLPPWVSHLTFDGILNDRDLRALFTILDTMRRLSSGEDNIRQQDAVSLGQTQGNFSSMSIRNSTQISRESWVSFFSMLGKTGPAKRTSASIPLSSLTVLDLSGNKLGDEDAAMVLELVHDRESGCNLEQLDLSGNRIGRGSNVVKVLRAYTEYYRYNQKLGVKMVRSSWKSSLHTLILAENDLFLGEAGLEIFALLKHNALCLRHLDLSSNGLEGDSYQLLASTLLKNTSLNHLNLSGNSFSPSLVDSILEHINGADAECGLSFLLLENNSPPLSAEQRRSLGRFLRKSRKNAIARLLKDRQKELEGGSNHDDPEEEEDTFDKPILTLQQMKSSRFKSTHSQASQRFNESSTSLQTETEEEDNMITVLFSAPLVFADEENALHPFAKLDFDMERELLWQCMKEASRDIAVAFDNAHHSRLLATLTKKCTCLHYSGHGHPHFLPFEDGMGGPNWLNVEDIKQLIMGEDTCPFKFVFVSACHSGLAGETFASAGVPHVVCCQQESELKDTAALAFTRSFYLSLAVGQTVKESFLAGCKAVRATPNLRDPEQEMRKFVLLPKDGNHNVPVFNAKPVREWPKQHRNQSLVPSKSRKRGSLMRMRSVTSLGAKSSELSTRNMMQEDPSPTAPQFFLGREVDMYYVLTALLKLRKRLVSVLGETGIGRSSLVCSICHYINERASTITEIQRIYFIKPKHGGRNLSCRSLLRQLLEKLKDAGKPVPDNVEDSTEDMMDAICKILKNDKALIVFDRTELLMKSDDAQEMPMLLSTLLYDTKQVKVLLTGRNPLGQPSIGGQVEHSFNLGPLNFANTIRLFASLCPHLHTPSERGMLLSQLGAECEEQADLFPGDPAMNEKMKRILAMVGDGVPARVEQAAYSLSKEDLDKLRLGSI